MPGVQVDDFSPAQLDRFRDCQQRAQQTLRDIADGLRAGDTERQVTRRLRKAFHRQGVHRYFHVPVALFGARTSYPGDFGPLGALATDTVLQPGMPVILDAAPIYGGYKVDTSLSLAFGELPAHEELLAQLRPFRETIAEMVRAGLNFRDIARRVDQQIREQGLENCHRKHIGAVLGHRVSYLRDSWLSRRRLWGLGAWQTGWFLARSLAARRRGDHGSPNWNHGRESDHPPTDGLWAVEPHIARDGIGVKFEELLVIQDGEVYWLSEQALMAA